MMLKISLKMLLFGMLILFVSSNALKAEFVNPSFEDDAFIPTIKDKDPNFWDVNLPSNLGGNVAGLWMSDESYSLTLFNKVQIFTPDYYGTVSQDVNLSDVNYLIFDLNLVLYYEGILYDMWDGTKVSAFIAVDGNSIWESAEDASGEYLNQTIDVNSFDGIRTISLGFKVKVSERLRNSYYAMFDNLRLVDDLNFYPCGGNGYYDADIDFDCFVDVNDLWLLCDYWLSVEFDMPYKQLYDINADGVVNFGDFALITAAMGSCSQAGGQGCTVPEDGLVPLEMDLNNDGTVNFADFAIAAGSLDYEVMGKIADEWLMIAPIKKVVGMDSGN